MTHGIAPRSIPELFAKKVLEPPRKPTSIVPSIDGELERIVVRALASDREKRQPNARALRDDLRKVLARLEAASANYLSRAMAITAPRMWLDGAIVATADARLPLMAHAAQRGSLVFDVGSFHATPRGPALFRAREHVERFLRSAKLVGLELDAKHDVAALVEAARLVVAETGKDDGLIRWSAFFDAAQPDLVPRSKKARIAVAAQLYEDPPRVSALRVATFDDARKAAPEALDPAVKAAAGYLGPMLARQRAIAARADEIVLLDRDGLVAEAPTANAFAVVKGALWTPPLRYVLAGITRDAVLTLARERGIAVREEPLPLEVFANADEAFLTATSFPIAPIGSVNGRAIASAPGPVTQRLIDDLATIQGGRGASHEAWVMLAR